VVISRFQRVRESVLLRTLGASRRQIRSILIVEYLLLGVLAATTGILLSIAASWALAAWVFEASFTPPIAAAVIAVLIVSALTVTIGLANSRGVVTRPPLEVLRAEAD
jgi:putative ABC transport system permease protein